MRLLATPTLSRARGNGVYRSLLAIYRSPLAIHRSPLAIHRSWMFSVPPVAQASRLSFSAPPPKDLSSNWKFDVRCPGFNRLPRWHRRLACVFRPPTKSVFKLEVRYLPTAWRDLSTIARRSWKRCFTRKTAWSEAIYAASLTWSRKGALGLGVNSPFGETDAFAIFNILTCLV